MAELFNLDELPEILTEPEAEKRAARAEQLPKGTYNSSPELQVSRYVAEDGRQNFKYFGRFEGTGETSGHTGFVAFWVSPDDRFKEDGTADLKTRMMNDAAKVYRLVNGLPAGVVVDKREVLKYLQKYPVAVRFIPGDQDEIGVRISRAKEIL